jgi:phosphoglycerol transferase MdoB-like AlkP superfamily enzyme
MSGFEVRESGSYAKLLTQQRDTLPKLFKAHGYRAVALMPGLKSAWPEGVFYGFDTIYGEQEIDYRGPDFGWWRIPDQYALASLHVLEPRRAERTPLFVFLPTINTHIPFLPTPPYQSDWARLHTAEPFDAATVAASVARTPDWESLGGPYGESFAYTFTYLAGYLREQADSDGVLVLLGDHQPASSVAGLGARWEVPAHIVTRRDDIAAALLAAGFIEGVELRPQQPTLGAMPELTRVLLHAFDFGMGTL